MKKCEIEQILKDTTPEQLEEISDFLVEKLGKSMDLDPAIAAADAAGESWIEGDKRFQCENVKKGRLCMRKEIAQDPALAKKMEDLLTTVKAIKKPDPALDLENLLTPDALIEKPDPAEGTIESMTPDALREVVQDPVVVKKADTAAATAKADLESLLTPDNLK
jgi:hypothetical protein